MKTTPVTLITIAEKAGVSVMTVSRALNDEGSVAAKTRAKVRAIAAELGYSPNLSAKMMKGSRTNVIGILVNDLQSAVINEIIGAVSSAVRKLEMDLVIYNSIGDTENAPSRGIGHMLHGLCDGLLLILPRISETHLRQLEQRDLPVVLVNYSRPTGLPVIRGGNSDGAAAATRHLLQLGHRRIGFITGSAFTGQSQERQQGYETALRGAGIDVDAKLVATGDFGRRSGYDAACALLTAADAPTAIFAANDEMAFGAIDAVRACGLQMPQDVSVIGFDDIPAAAHVHPALTTVRQPLAAISEAAVRELLLRITGAGGEQRRLEFPSELVLRDSTAKAPGRAGASHAAGRRASLPEPRRATATATPEPRRSKAATAPRRATPAAAAAVPPATSAGTARKRAPRKG
jgi:LacI family transcriptional regulator